MWVLSLVNWVSSPLAIVVTLMMSFSQTGEAYQSRSIATSIPALERASIEVEAMMRRSNALVTATI